MNKFFLFIALFAILISCSKEEIKESIIKEKSLDLQVLEAYQEGVKSLETGDVLYAAKKFNQAEILFPQSEWAPKSALMASYSFYLQNYYAEALSNLERFLKTYPNNKDEAYVHYLIAMCYYETIEDEKRDSAPLFFAKNKFNFIIINFPNTDFALDSKFKLGVIEDILASKEMYLGRYYFDRKKWIPSINRFRKVIDDYSQTIYVEEALHRLVEVHYTLGLVDEATKYANLLGYNYQSSEWYKKTYGFFNKTYEKNRLKQEKKNKENIIKRKFKSLFE